jgi:hypothetical protein
MALGYDLNSQSYQSKFIEPSFWEMGSCTKRRAEKSRVEPGVALSINPAQQSYEITTAGLQHC